MIFGAKLSAKAPSGPLRWALATVLSASGVKLLGATNVQLVLVVVAGLAVGAVLLLRSRRVLPVDAAVAGPAPEAQLTPTPAAPPPVHLADAATAAIVVSKRRPQRGDSGAIDDCAHRR